MRPVSVWRPDMTAPLSAAVATAPLIRVWLALLGLRNLVFGAVLLIDTERFADTRTFSVAERMAPLWLWAVVLIAVGVVAAVGVVTLARGAVRLALVLSAGLAAAWAAAFGLALIEAPGASVIIAGTFLTITGKDLLLCSMTLVARDR